MSHETIYNAMYGMPKGALRSKLLSCRGKPHASGERRQVVRVDEDGFRDTESSLSCVPEVEDIKFWLLSYVNMGN